jgi:predicted TPR repeat methyltransferase
LARLLGDRRPVPPGLDYLSGLLALAAGDGRKAAQHLSKAAKLTPEAIPPRLAYARAQTQQGRLDHASGAYRLVLVLAPAMADAHHELGEALQRAGRYADSLPPLRRAAVLGSPSAALLNNLGVALRAHDRRTPATAAFRAAIAMKPEGAKAYANLASVTRLAAGRTEAILNAQRAARIEPEVAEHWLEVGQSRYAAKKFDSAVTAYQAAAKQDPDNAKPIWLLAELLIDTGRYDEAVPHLQRVLELTPDDPYGAALALAHLGAAPAPGQAPAAHLRTLYDQYAPSFDANLVGDLSYRGPAILTDAIRHVLGDGPFDILDAGCGTGLSGVALRPHARRLDGVDLSPRMVDQARARRIYDSLAVDDLLAALSHQPAAYDLVAAADVLIYQGDLTPVASAAYRALRAGGGFAFTVEKTAISPFSLSSDTGRFAHSADHLRAVAAQVGFVVVHLADVSTRREGGKPVSGFCCVMQRP